MREGSRSAALVVILFRMDARGPEWLSEEGGSDGPPPIPSATVVVLRPGSGGAQVLLLRRHADLAFHGGAWVFPGGRVEEGESAGEAAVREAYEESGVALDAGALAPFARWITPRGRPRRFTTEFFVTELARDAPLQVDGREIAEARYWSPAEALAARAAGALTLPPPTFVTLSRLVAEGSLLARAFEEILPRPVAVRGGVCALYPGDAGYQGARIDAEGPRHRAWLLDDGWRYERRLEENREAP